MDIKLDKFLINNDSKTFFIADIAANHDGDLGRALELINLAKDSGANAAKFQHFSAETIVSPKGFEKLGSKIAHQTNWDKSVYEVYQEASVPPDWTNVLFTECEKIGIEFMSTPYSFSAVDLLDPYVNAFKIGSGDINWIEEIELIASKRKPIFLATGASELNEVREAVDVIQKHGVPLCLMQCNTNYSGQFSNFNYINLNVLKQYKKLFPNVILGLSDHTEGHTTVLGAIALGAKVVEKHFTDDKNRKGPDHKFSMSPKGWKEMVDRSLELQLSLGSGLKKIEMNEEESVLVQRRSLRAKGNLSKGKIITRDDLTILRPAPLNSISPNKINEVLGKKLNKDVGNDENLYWGDIEI